MSMSARRSHTFLDHMGTHDHSHASGVRTDRAKRYESDLALRLAAVQRLDQARERLDDAIRRCLEQESFRGINALERLRAHLDRIAVRMRAAGWDKESVPHSWAHHPAETDALFRLDQSIHDHVNLLIERFETRAVDHDFLAHVREDLGAIERLIDERAISKQEIFQK